ncbi:Phage antirepressor protein [Thauera aromatica K172]|uniref:Phage antirepressor protein n=2 Tax=Thauera aromatica TaxID=59405 RepID=A0A2R4BP79_THAAR|nr:Phage antirepressor protein [Thauera aromatica K172]
MAHPAQGASTALVPVFTGTLAGIETLLCNARDLHAFLQVGKKFPDWIKLRIEQYGFVEGEDFTVCFPNLGSKTRGGHNSTDYHLSLDMAKELSMVENNAQGRLARRYFIAMEKQALGLPAPAAAPVKRAIRSRDDLSFTRRDEQGRLINWSVAHGQDDDWGAAFAQGAAFFAEVAQLAEFDEAEACKAIQTALSGPAFDHAQQGGFSGAWGQECGFAEAVARAAIAGLRALREGDVAPFEPHASRGRAMPPNALPKPRKPKALPAPSVRTIQ